MNIFKASLRKIDKNVYLQYIYIVDIRAIVSLLTATFAVEVLFCWEIPFFIEIAFHLFN